jgi:hypothetical protein
LASEPDTSSMSVLNSGPGGGQPVADRAGEGSVGGLGEHDALVRRWSPRAVIAVGLLTFAVLAGFLLRWWTHPDLFTDFGGGIGMGAKPVEKAQWTFAVVYPPGGLGEGHDPASHTITFTDVPDVQLSPNSARASVVFSVCTPEPGPRGTFIGAANGTGARYCDTLTAIRAGVTMPWPTLGAYIVGTLTPKQAGRIHLTGVDFHYSLGRDHWWRRGVDHVTLDVRQRVSLNIHARPD